MLLVGSHDKTIMFKALPSLLVTRRREEGRRGGHQGEGGQETRGETARPPALPQEEQGAGQEARRSEGHPRPRSNAEHRASVQ